MSETCIKIENLSKRYRIGANEGYKTFRETLVDSLTAPFRRLARIGALVSEAETLWALDDVSFEVKEGEAVGIIGKNGAGKTTILKILSRITEPTKGQVRLRGKVGSLLEVGTGFHSELTGHENIYLYGAILGMGRGEISRKFDEIVAFAEVGKFIDTPVKRYSSGMYMRLAFAVAAHLEPDILLVDEVLAVGDAVFQTKCLAKMKSITGQGRTILFVSHNLGAISSICQKGIVLDEGKVRFSGDIREAVDFYQGDITNKKYLRMPIAERKDRSGTGEVRLVSFHMEDERGKRIEKIPNGSTVRLVFGYRTRDKRGAEKVDLNLSVEREVGERIFQLGTRFTGQRFDRLPAQGHIVCTMKRFPLVPGRYNLGTYLQCESRPADYITELIELDVIDGDFYGSNYQIYEKETRFLVEGTWSQRPL